MSIYNDENLTTSLTLNVCTLLRLFLSPLVFTSDDHTRVCDHCFTTIEDEFHFLMQCPKYSHLRNNFFSIVQKRCKNILLLDSKLQFNWLLANSDDLVILRLADFIFDCFEIHCN